LENYGSDMTYLLVKSLKLINPNNIIQFVVFLMRIVDASYRYPILLQRFLLPYILNPNWIDILKIGLI